ncbi:hypothetical protein FA15DRAFT_710214 [Coprinopsis marcescibilis]|uniref:Uncharacterized protein n=1 Tax=Coprinopsis marcescibilis TaxID=230819 RepID=A0A5C3KE61_COPMA|nr:hypothetical protein FA15DRAFT_710214 [Coprinopsis marcescibilis]
MDDEDILCVIRMTLKSARPGYWALITADEVESWTVRDLRESTKFAIPALQLQSLVGVLQKMKVGGAEEESKGSIGEGNSAREQQAKFRVIEVEDSDEDDKDCDDEDDEDDEDPMELDPDLLIERQENRKAIERETVPQNQLLDYLQDVNALHSIIDAVREGKLATDINPAEFFLPGGEMAEEIGAGVSDIINKFDWNFGLDDHQVPEAFLPEELEESSPEKLEAEFSNMPETLKYATHEVLERCSRTGEKRQTVDSDPDNSDTESEVGKLPALKLPKTGRKRQIVMSDSDGDASDTESGIEGLPTLKLPKTGEKQQIIMSDSSDADANIGRAFELQSGIHPIRIPPNSPRRQKVTRSVGVPLSEVFQTATMQAYNLEYNNKYGVLLCRECQHAVCADMLVRHLEGVSFYPIPQWNEDTRKWSPGNKKHSFYLSPATKAKNNLIKTISKEIAAVTGEKTPPKILGTRNCPKIAQEVWLKQVIPVDDQVGPIAGLRQYKGPGYFCTELLANGEPCRYAALRKENLISQHRTIYHPVGRSISGNKGYRKEEGVILQSFCLRGDGYWFKVAPGPEPPASSSTLPSPRMSVSDAFAAEDAAFAEQIQDDSALEQDKLIRQCFHTSGFLGVWELVEIDQIQELHAICSPTRARADLPTQRFILGTASAFLAISEKIPKSHSSILKVLGEGSAAFRPVKGMFTVPSYRTLTHYLLWDIQFLTRMMRVAKKPLYRKDGSKLFVFNAAQATALEDLRKAIQQVETVAKIASLSNDALLSLYFPANVVATALDRTKDPLFVYLACLSLKTTGEPDNIEEQPCRFAKVQYSIRIRAFHRFYMDYNRAAGIELAPLEPKIYSLPKVSQKRARGQKNADRPAKKPRMEVPPSDEEEMETPPSDDDEEQLQEPTPLAMKLPPEQDVSITPWALGAGEDSDSEGDGLTNLDLELNIPIEVHQGWLKWAKQYLSEDGLSPYSLVRMAMKIFSQEVFNSRKGATTDWSANDNTLYIKENQLNVQDFVDFVSHRLKSTEEDMSQYLLFGTTLNELGIKCDFSEMKEAYNTTDLAENCFKKVSDPPGRATNPDAQRLITHLQGTLYELEDGGGKSVIHWNQSKIIEWQLKLWESTRAVAALAHLLQGSPGRGTEEAIMQISNTRSGRRHIFVDKNLQTLAIYANYHKGVTVTGRFKEVLRFLPYRVARLLWILIRVLRPIERLYVLRMSEGDQEQQKKIDKAYRQCLWVSMGAPAQEGFVSESLKAFFRRKDERGGQTFQWIGGIRDYRQLAVALQRKRIPGAFRFTKDMVANSGSIGDAQAGRSQAASYQNYAIEKDLFAEQSPHINHYRQFSIKWQEMFGIASSQSEALKPNSPDFLV